MGTAERVRRRPPCRRVAVVTMRPVENLDTLAPGGDDITIADYLGAGMVSLGELIHCDLSQYPNLAHWYAAMKARPNWAKVNETFYGFVGALKDKTFEVV